MLLFFVKYFDRIRWFNSETYFLFDGNTPTNQFDTERRDLMWETSAVSCLFGLSPSLWKLVSKFLVKWCLRISFHVSLTCIHISYPRYSISDLKLDPDVMNDSFHGEASVPSQIFNHSKYWLHSYVLF